MKTPPTDPLSYASYLKVEELLSLQRPLSNPMAHDEMLFIVIHQVYELWFKLILFELESVNQKLEIGDILSSFHGLDRICEVMKILVQQIDVLETMTPTDFNRFRSNLNPASGFQSLQFRELEILSGASAEEYEKFSKLMPEWRDKISRRSKTSSLKSAFIGLLQRQGLLEVKATADQITRAVLKVYQGSDRVALRDLCERLLRFDEQFQLWRFRHVQMVERMIGMKPGTGGSLGVAYLSQTLKRRFFTELWEARTLMGDPDSYGASKK